MKRKTILAIIISSALLITIIVLSAISNREKEIILKSEVEQGQFNVTLNIVGELQAINETDILGPSALRSRGLRIRNVTIQELIPEGTVVDSGDWVATLDRSEVDNSLKDIVDRIEQQESEFLRIQLDTTMQLRQLRNDLVNLNYAVEESKIALEQSQYEPPAVVRQAEIQMERNQRAYNQANANYSLKQQQFQAEMREVEINLNSEKRDRDEIVSVLNQFDVVAQASGMVIYKKEWDGAKRTAGTQINTNDLAVATLPDLSSMLSLAYINEIDISNIKVGQLVWIVVDAFPEKSFTGSVTELSNVGQELPGTNAKVFEVKIVLNEHDNVFRPSMTTSNEIVTNIYEDVLFIPLETVHAVDSTTFVYTIDGRKQEVVLGESNENHIIVEQGLEAGEELYLSMPLEPELFTINEI